jgi:hypothetical protein
MVQPIDYRINVQSPFEAALGGFKVGAGMAEMQQQRELARQKLQQQQIAAQEAARNKGYLTLAAQSLAAIDSGNTDAAVNLMQGRIDAARNSGDEEQANALDTWLQLVKFNPQSASSVINRLVMNTPGGKEMLDAAKVAGQEQREAALHPSALVEARAKADLAIADAKSAQATARNAEEKAAADTALARANADKAKIEAKYAEQIAQADIKKKAADLGLTQAQTKQALAATNKLGAESQKVALELKALQASGGVDPTKKFELEDKLRKEYLTQTKPYQEVKSAYGRVLSSQNTAVGDISLIFGYMKMLDPGSVVREGEFATAQNAAGVPDRITNLYNKVISGQRLNPSQRDSFKGQAKGLYDSALEGEKTVRTGLERISKDYGLKTENIFYSPTEKAPTAQDAQPPANPQRNVQVSY